MRHLACALVAATIFVAGCSGVGSDANAPFNQGLSAFRSGDREALTASIQALRQEASTTAEFCTAEGLSAERSRIMAELLRLYERGPLMSMSEEARMLYLERTFMSGADLSGDHDVEDCRGQIDAAVFMHDALQRQAMVKTVIKAGGAWREDLASRYGAELDSRMASAEHLLNVYNLGV